MSERLNPPKGTRDFAPGELQIRQGILRKIEDAFKLYDYRGWDGPIFENLEILTKKSGPSIQDQIYSFKDKGDRSLGLRFDLTTSLSRIIASNPNLKKPVKTYSFGKVFRYEKPQLGRYREFLQMDADIFGCATVLAETELLSLVSTILEKLHLSNFIILLNDRMLLSCILLYCNIAQEKHANVLRLIDKKDKISSTDLQEQLLEETSSPDSVKKLITIIHYEGSNEEKLTYLKSILKEEPALLCLQNIQTILSSLKTSGIEQKIQLDFSLVRGQDYYTGTIFEYKIVGGLNVGSIGGGGRYDQYVETFGGVPTPAVGASFGIERLIDIINSDDNLKKEYIEHPRSVFVATMNESYTSTALAIVSQLRNHHICANLDLNQRAYKKQLSYALGNNYNYLITIGEEELLTQSFPLKDLYLKQEAKFPIEEIIKKIVNI